jgi:hypothetical protein
MEFEGLFGKDEISSLTVKYAMKYGWLKKWVYLACTTYSLSMEQM